MIFEYASVYSTLCRLGDDSGEKLVESRGKVFAEAVANRPLIKVAFDTRRVDQQLEFIPRRNLQNYHRAEEFISNEVSDKVKSLFRVKNAIDDIKEEYQYDPAWLDSYCRILSGTLDRTLRISQQDMDFFQPQLQYVEELLDVRYRLKLADLPNLNERELRNALLVKDEKLTKTSVYSEMAKHKKVTKDGSSSGAQIIKGQEASLIEQLFGVKASAENPTVTRTISITIRDSIVDEPKE